MDPTLLIDKETWISLSKPINDLTISNFIFLYILGDDYSVYSKVADYADSVGLNVVSIQFANGYTDNNHTLDERIKYIKECSPANFLWLIYVSKLVITDSFHGVALSTNLDKNFYSIKREGKNDINIRIKDFLKISNQENKLISINNLSSIVLDNPNSQIADINKYKNISNLFIREVICSVEGKT